MNRLLCFLFALSWLFPPGGSPQALAASEDRELASLVDRAKTTLDNFAADSNMTWFREHVKEAKGIFIVPRMWKGAFFFGGEGGTGVFLAKHEATGEWSDPAFYTMGTASVGFQFGVQASEIVLFAMTQRGVESMLTNTFKLGADVSVAAGPVGAGVEGATAVLSADLVTFSRTKGLFGGLSLEGAVIAVRDESNRRYYGKEVRPTEILIMRTVSNPQSAGLRAALARLTGSKTPPQTDPPSPSN
ncbi:MAG: lipid-binding SYLF domain-containing protein [Nitrospira sp.]|nr:lipid-binding SYLF domain-containing protein [Nitrospira sp.]